MANKDLITVLQYQVDDKSREIGENSMKNVKLRMDRQHIQLAIDALVSEGEQ